MASSNIKRKRDHLWDILLFPLRVLGKLLEAIFD